MEVTSKPTIRVLSFSSVGISALAATLLLSFVALSAVGHTGQVAAFQIHSLEDGVNMPFPQPPTLLGSMEQDGVTQHLYQGYDEDYGVGITATVMRDVMAQDGEAQDVLKGFLSGTVQSMGGRVEAESAISVSGLPGRVVVIHMDQYQELVRSHTVAIYDEGRVHTWAIQDIPQLTGRVAERMFEENISKISVVNDPWSVVSVYRIFNLYDVEGLRMPFPGAPEKSELPYGDGKLTMWSYMDRESGILFYAGIAEELPSASDPAAAFLRGAARGHEVIASNEIQVAGMPGRYHIIEGKESGGVRHTYTVAFEFNGKIVSWSAHVDPESSGENASDVFFRQVKRITLP